MNIKNLLVPTDFSPSSAPALIVAQSLARDQGAKIHLLHVLPSLPEQGQVMMAYAFEDEEAIAARRQIDALAADASDLAIERHLVRGEPIDQILRAAGERSADLIVIGTHGRKGLTHLLMGSIAEGVLRRAECPVLTVKPPPRPTPSPTIVDAAGAFGQPPIP